MYLQPGEWRTKIVMSGAFIGGLNFEATVAQD
jgi:hypothetical protein